jgi:hypothetical protein
VGQVTSNWVRPSSDYIEFHDAIYLFDNIFDDYDVETEELTSAELNNGGVKQIRFYVHSPDDCCWQKSKNQQK